MPRRKLSAEDGTATLEFIAAGLILLVPLVYLVLAMAAIQGGAFAVEGAARQAARVYVQAGNERSAVSDADRAVEFALADYGLHREDAAVSISCSPRSGWRKPVHDSSLSVAGSHRRRPRHRDGGERGAALAEHWRNAHPTF